MEYTIERITKDSYPRFDDMIFWRTHGVERPPAVRPISQQILQALENPNLYLYATCVEARYVGWISLVYIPKVGKWQGHGHLYVDELWVAPAFRRQGLAKALLCQADALQAELQAIGIRLYVNTENPSAKRLYEQCGYQEDGRAYLMEKAQ